MAVVEKYCNESVDIGHLVDEFPKSNDFRMHIHDKHEILCLVSGNADFIVEGNTYHLKPGSIVIARIAESHMLKLNGSEPYDRYVVNFSPEYFLRAGFSPEIFKAFDERKIGEKNIYYPDELGGIYPIEFFGSAFEDSHHNKGEDVFKSRLAVLLCALNTAFQNKSKISYSSRFSDNGLIDYINRNLFENISLEDISKEVHLSVSQINRTFKKLTGSTVHKYVISKRLIAAKKMISEGKSALEACQLSGFNDYSAFFRIYKKRFGTAPTAAK